METAKTETASKSLPRLTRRQALLLLGGALCLALAGWTVTTYRLVREAAMPDGVLGMMRFVRLTPSAAAFQAYADPAIAVPLKEGFAITQEPTLFAYADEDGTVRWHLLEALSVERKPGGWRLVPRDIDAYGWFGAEKQPFSLTLDPDRYRLQIGHRERGLSLVPEPAMVLAPSLLPSAPLASAYAVFSEDASYFVPDQAWPSGGAFANLVERAPRPVEVIVGSASGTPDPAFVLISGSERRSVGFQDAEPLLRRLAGERDPIEKTVSFADSTTSVEMLNGENKVIFTEKKLLNGFLYQLTGAAGKHALTAFQDENRLWISKDAVSLQGLMMGSLQAIDPAKDSCLPSFRIPGFVFGQEAGVTPFSLVGFTGARQLHYLKSTTIRRENSVSGLFTVCGYY